MATSKALTMYRGDSYPIELTLVNEDTGIPFNLQNCSLLLTVNSDLAPATDANEIFQVAGVIVDAVGGIATFTPTVLDTDVMPKVYYYDVQLTDSDGNIRTIIKSTFTITMDITK